MEYKVSHTSHILLFLVGTQLGMFIFVIHNALLSGFDGKTRVENPLEEEL